MIIRKFKNLIYSKSIRNEKIINIDNYREFRFAFFGELGYGLICFFPFLYYVTKREGIKLKTIGLKGSVPFFDDFSCDHIELDIQQGDCWGSRELFWNFKLRKSCSEYLIFPDDNTNLNLFNLKWIHTKLSTNFTKNSCFLPLEFEKIQGTQNFKNYVVINIKNYYNWGNRSIENFYTEYEIIRISKYFAGHLIILNTPRLPVEPHNISADITVNSYLGHNVITSDKYYQDCANLCEINIKQISLFKGADVVFSTQGGNTPLSMYCNDDVRVIMRGGFDFPDYLSIAEHRKIELKIGYSVDQLFL